MKRRPVVMPPTEIERQHPLATERGLGLFIGLLLHMGAMCPKCGFGTRATSKRWAKCKRCGEGAERRAMPKEKRRG